MGVKPVETNAAFLQELRAAAGEPEVELVNLAGSASEGALHHSESMPNLS